mgnify:CR=1 FL=1
MIQALHKAGIGVIMDVVYNHTYRHENVLNHVMPGYFSGKTRTAAIRTAAAAATSLPASAPWPGGISSTLSSTGRRNTTWTFPLRPDGNLRRGNDESAARRAG